MFNDDKQKLEKLGAYITVSEVKQQPSLWLETLQIYLDNKERLDSYINSIVDKCKTLRVIFTGAGSSAFAGNVVCDHLVNQSGPKITFESIATTDIVACPKTYLRNEPTLLVSFARSGNSPESLQAVELGRTLIDDFYNLALTCAQDGKLAQELSKSDKDYVLLMPPASNDKAFAMTGSFSCMTLSALLIFDKLSTLEEKKSYVDTMVKLGVEIIQREDEITKYLENDYDRVVYLGSGPLASLAREAQLKILELTAGQIATCYESSMGFRHGPKSFIDNKTLAFVFISTDSYTKQYDVDIVNEVYFDKIVSNIVAVTKDEISGEFNKFTLKSTDAKIKDAYLSLPYLIFAQVVAIASSLKVGNLPDTPSKSGTVNRVVKGVVIHQLEK